MNKIEKKEIVQAILLADGYSDNFQPFTDSLSLALLPLVNVPLIDYALEALNRSGVEEVIVFCNSHVAKVRQYIQQQQKVRCSWSLGTAVTVVNSEGCRNMGDALRDLDAKGMIRGNVILSGVDTITNANLKALLEEHKQASRYDKGAAMTVVYKQGNKQPLRTGNEVMIVTDKHTNRLLFHQRLQPQPKERNFSIPLEVFVEGREITVHHGLIDPQIAICSNTALPLFSDNFDFLTRDDFVRGLLINEELLNSRIYVSMLPCEEYGMRINNWQSYQIVSRDVANRWLYPIVPDMSVTGYKRHYTYGRNNNYRHRDIHLARGSSLKSDVVIDEDCYIGEQTVVEQTVLGKHCKIGKNCIIRNCFLFCGVEVGDGCVLENCVAGVGSHIGAKCTVKSGCVIGDGVYLPEGKSYEKLTIQANKPESDELQDYETLGNHAYVLLDELEPTATDDGDSDEAPPPNAFWHQIPLSDMVRDYPESVYSALSDDAESRTMSPVQEDANIFLSEVLESLKRGFTEKSNPEYLILEINSSRYAYNMALSEVNFYVVSAILQILLQQKDVEANAVKALHVLLTYFGPVLKNYIRGKDAMLDCLRAFEDVALTNEVIRTKLAELVYYLYEKDIVAETEILVWYKALEEESLIEKLSKLAEWLMESSEEEDDDDDE